MRWAICTFEDFGAALAAETVLAQVRLERGVQAARVNNAHVAPALHVHAVPDLAPRRRYRAAALRIEGVQHAPVALLIALDLVVH